MSATVAFSIAPWAMVGPATFFSFLLLIWVTWHARREDYWAYQPTLSHAGIGKHKFLATLLHELGAGPLWIQASYCPETTVIGAWCVMRRSAIVSRNRSHARTTGRRLVLGLIPNSFKSERWSPLLRQVVHAFMSKAGRLLLRYSNRPSIWLVAELYMACKWPPFLARPPRPPTSAAESSACARIGGWKPFLSSFGLQYAAMNLILAWLNMSKSNIGLVYDIQYASPRRNQTFPINRAKLGPRFSRGAGRAVSLARCSRWSEWDTPARPLEGGGGGGGGWEFGEPSPMRQSSDIRREGECEALGGGGGGNVLPRFAAGSGIA